MLYSIKNPDKCSCYTCQYVQLTLIILAVEIISMGCAVNIVTLAVEMVISDGFVVNIVTLL